MGFSMQARRLLSTLVAATMLSTSCAALSAPTAADVPPPPVNDTINTEAAFPDDGLTRLIVTPIAGAPISAGVNDDGSTPILGDSGAAAPIDPTRMLTPEMVAAMPPGAVLEARNGRVGYVDANGEFVAFDPAALPAPPVVVEEPEESEPTPEIVPLYGNPYIDALAADPAVEGIVVIGDGTFGVETSDPSVVDPAVFASVPDVPFTITEDQYEPYQWHLENDGTNLDRVTQIAQSDDADLDITPTLERADGQGVVVAVIDTGVDFSHPDLENSSWSNLGETCGNGIDDDGNGYVDDCTGWDFANNDAQPYSSGSHAHGTHVAGIITANRDGGGVAGVAPDARIMDLNVAYSDGSMSGAAITAAIRYAVDNGADIINMSLGTNPGASAQGLEGMLDAIDYAGSSGVLVVVAAGNSNVDIGSLAVYPASFDRPNMIVVGASSPDDTKASFSNFNSDIVDLYAPGVLILSTTPRGGYYFMSGTSQASPATAAVAAMVMETSPDASIELVIDQVVSTVDPVDALSTSAANGRANAASALGLGDAPPIPTEIDVSVAGLLGAGNEVNAEVAIVTPPEAFDEDYRWELSLLNTTDSGTYAIIEQPFVVDGADTATGATGAVILGSSALESAAVSTSLPDGQYSFVIEAVPTADGSSRLGDAFVVTFQVGGGTVVVEETTTTTAATAPVDGGNGDGDGSDGADPDPGDGVAGTPTTTAPGQDATTSTTSPTAEPGTPVTTAPITTSPSTTSPSTTAPTPDTGPVTTTPGSPATTAPPSDGSTPDTDDQGSGTTPDAPTTTAPGNSTPPESSPPNTVPTSPAPVPPSVGDDTASEGDWSINSITPQAGYVDNANSVTIRGSFPTSAYVWFGEQPGQVVYQTDEVITVRTPLRSAEGVVDVSLRSTAAGTVLTVDDAYAFVAWGDDQPTGTPGTSDGTTGGDSDSGDTDSGDTDSGDTDSGDSGNGNAGDDNAGDGDADGGTDNGNSDDDGSSEEGSSDDQPVGDRGARMTVGSAVDLPSGLKGAAISPNPAANTTPCSTERCSAVRR